MDIPPTWELHEKARTCMADPTCKKEIEMKIERFEKAEKHLKEVFEKKK